VAKAFAQATASPKTPTPLTRAPTPRMPAAHAWFEYGMLRVTASIKTSRFVFVGTPDHANFSSLMSASQRPSTSKFRPTAQPVASDLGSRAATKGCSLFPFSRLHSFLLTGLSRRNGPQTSPEKGDPGSFRETSFIIHYLGWQASNRFWGYLSEMQVKRPHS
jgi:hypothetical protein